MPSADCLSVDARFLKTWRHQLIKAQHFSNDESTIYPLIDSILNAFILVIETDDDTTINCHPQHRLSGNSVYDHVRSLTDALSAIPDFALILDHFRDLHFEYSRILLLFEIKRLLLQGSDHESWFHPLVHGFATTDFKNHLDQVMLQGFVSWHVYKQDNIHLVLVIGVYYTLLRFARPSPDSLVSLPTYPSRFGRNTVVADLVPRKHQPQMITFMRPMFKQDKDGAVELTDDFRRLLLMGVRDGKGILPCGIQPCSLFQVDNPEPDFDTTPAEMTDFEDCINAWYDKADTYSATVSKLLKTPPRVGDRLSYADLPLSPGEKPTPESSPYVPRVSKKKRKLSDDNIEVFVDVITRRISEYKEGMAHN